jgi:hypothetical protein
MEQWRRTGRYGPKATVRLESNSIWCSGTLLECIGPCLCIGPMVVGRARVKLRSRPFEREQLLSMERDTWRSMEASNPISDGPMVPHQLV